ncbi:hypothetical protein [Sulfurimonas sp.]|uniref:hypothetical protein n=1 Tax=Sulfurimonas sp. TaxID=2022749 RepID=UPI003D1411C6
MSMITNSQMKILEALARYTFLTVPLIDTLKIFKNPISIYRSLKGLKERSKPLIITQSFGVHPTRGQLHSLIYLSQYAKEILLDNGFKEEDINIPSQKTFVSTDYFHRVANLQTHVSMDLYLQSLENANIIFLDYYFSKITKNKEQYSRALNRIDLDDDKYMIPDIVTKFQVDDKEYLYLIEIHNGDNSNKAFAQCLQHIKAINLGSPKTKYKHSKNNRVVFIFEQEACMNSVMKKMNSTEGLQKYLNLFLFKTINEIKDNFATEWLKFNNELTIFL